jgi:ABC-2 type transport system permease protein
MRKTLCIAAREYRAAVYTKAFIISIILLPLMMFGGVLMQKVSQTIGDHTTKRVAVIDRTPGAELFPVLEKAAEQRNQNEILDKKTGKQMHAKFVFERTEPAPLADADAVLRQRFDLSERIRQGALFAIVEIGPDVLNPKLAPDPLTPTSPPPDTASAEQKLDAAEALIGESNLIRYTSNQPTYSELNAFLQRTLPQEIFGRRLNAAQLPSDKVLPLLIPPQIAQRGLIVRDASGALTQDKKVNQIAATLVPLALLILMFMVVMVGASPMAMNVIEEKQLRIAEVLLGSVRPFELMMGKLLGGVGVALTLATIYVGGILLLANQYGVAGYVSPTVLAWFLVFTVMATLMYGSIFIAAGAAVTNAKEAQSLIAPIMIFIMLPLFVLQPLLNDPSGPMPTAGSFFPLSAPMMTTARLAIPPGIPLWQALLSVVISLLTTTALVWCAGRIFRVGLLLQGQAAKPRELLKWIWKG